MKAPALLFALALGACAPSFAADSAPPANRYAATIMPAERFESGSLLVERHGAKGSPLILIPGLASGAWVWQDAIRNLAFDHTVYVLTLPGFDGRAAVAGNAMESARQSLEQLIVSRKLAHPVLVGHSLGGTLSIDFAERRSDLIGGVVAIDGLPVFPGTENMPAAQRGPMAAGMKARVDATPRAGFAAQQQQYMRTIGVLDMPKADELAKLSAASDPGAVGEYMAEVLAADLRPGLKDIKVPVLVISPYFQADAEQQGITEAMKTGYYKSLMAGTPRVEVVSVSPSRHFAMFDQPAMVAEAIRAYLKSL